MRLEEVVTNKRSPKETNPRVLAKWIKKACAPWLAAMNGKVCYRGVGYGSMNSQVLANQYRISTHQNRKMSMYGSPTLPIFYNSIIAQATSKPLEEVAHRMNSRFVSMNRSETDTFGTPVIMLPIGPFTTTHNTLFTDWNIDLGDELMQKRFDEVFDLPAILDHFPNDEEWVKTKVSTQFPLKSKTWIDILNHCVEDGVLPINLNNPKIKQAIENVVFDKPIESDGNELMVKSSHAIYVGLDLYHEIKQILEGTPIPSPLPIKVKRVKRAPE